MIAQIQFQEYHVTKVDFKYDPFYRGGDGALVPYFDYRMEPGENGDFWVTLLLSIGDEHLKDSAIYISTSLMGLFRLLLEGNDDEIPDEQMRRYKANAIAILYSYLRGLVSDITSKGTSSPLILPTMNVVAYMVAQEKPEVEQLRPTEVNPQ